MFGSAVVFHSLRHWYSAKITIYSICNQSEKRVEIQVMRFICHVLMCLICISTKI